MMGAVSPVVVSSNEEQSAMSDLLKACVVEATGNKNATARPSQAWLALDVLAALSGQAATSPTRPDDERAKAQAIAQAPTGSGKSLATGVPAMLRAARHGERSIVSTASLGLMDQLVGKDFPLIASVIEREWGETVSFCAMKGWSNYVCPALVVDAAVELLDEKGAAHVAGLVGCPPPDIASTVGASASQGSTRDIVALGREVDAMVDVPAQRSGRSRVDHHTEVHSKTVPTNAFRALVHAACETVNDTDAVGDRHSFRVSFTDDMWSAISTSPGECIGAECPFAAVCPAMRSRRKAAESDVVVTNHSMLAIQAAKDVPLVVGSDRLGAFENVIVDECHELPAIVRSQGSVSVSASRIRSIARRVAAVSNAPSADVDQFVADADVIADAVGAELERDFRAVVTAGRKRGGDHVSHAVVGESGAVLSTTVELIESFLARAARLIEKDAGTLSGRIAAARSQNAVSKFREALNAALQHDDRQARWIEKSMFRDRETFEVKVAPVDVGGLLSSNLWKSRVPVDADDVAAAAEFAAATGDYAGFEEVKGDADERVDMSVVCVSATVPSSFRSDAGLACPSRQYPSPFEEAYARSVLFIPKANADEVALLSGRSQSRRPRMDTAAHAPWSRGMAAQLVAANNGSALVLCTTSANGQQMADVIREHLPAMEVLSQWDGVASQELLARWKSRRNSVLVATRSYMTGVDAPGATCDLVIIDRVPRNAPNPVDDARAALVHRRMGISEWVAKERVYASDAAALLAQAAGRLIRHADDDGVVAILDPRLHVGGPLAFGDESMAHYRKALGEFTVRESDVQSICTRMMSKSRGRA